MGEVRSGMVVVEFELHVGQICFPLSARRFGTFRLSSKHWSHMEGICLLVE